MENDAIYAFRCSGSGFRLVKEIEGNFTSYYLSGNISAGIGIQGSLPESEIRFPLSEAMYNNLAKEMAKNPNLRVVISGDLELRLKTPCFN